VSVVFQNVSRESESRRAVSNILSSSSFVNGSNCRKHKLKDHPDELAAFEAVHGRGKSAIQALHSMMPAQDA
jgi:hypothetical protein